MTYHFDSYLLLKEATFGKIKPCDSKLATIYKYLEEMELNNVHRALEDAEALVNFHLQNHLSKEEQEISSDKSLI